MTTLFCGATHVPATIISGTHRFFQPFNTGLNNPFYNRHSVKLHEKGLALNKLEWLTLLKRYQRATNYLTAAQIYLQSNFLLEHPLSANDIKPRLLGHWGTAPGINLVCAHLNRLILSWITTTSVLCSSPGQGTARQPTSRTCIWKAR